MASSSLASSSSCPPAQALWALQDPILDHNGVFTGAQGDFNARLVALRASGFSVVSQVFELFEKVEEYMKQHYPDGIDLLGFRMHASEKRLPLSHQPGGVYALQDADAAAAGPVQNIFSKVRKFVMIEGCQTGFGKQGILKHVVGLCPAGVIGIGSKGSEFEVGFDPILPGYMSFHCLQSKQDITRIYYKAENGSVQNIPAGELMLLWDLFKEKCTTPEEKQRGFELCYQLLGGRNDPVTFACIRSENKELIDLVIGDFKAIRQQLLEVHVVKSRAKAIWAEMLNTLEALKDDLGGKNESTEILVNKEEREKTADQVVTKRGLLVADRTPYQKVYLFLLGCAFIDKYKPLLMLLDDGAKFGLASQAIHALSALTVHGDDNLSITTILGHYFSIIKKSYLAGKNSFLIKQWFQGISKGICFNNQIKFIDEFYEERIVPSKEERLRTAILKDDEMGVQSLIAQGAELLSPDLEIDRLFLDAIDRGSYFIAFLLHEQLYAQNDSEFMDSLALEYRNQSCSKHLDAQFCLIATYLAGKGNVDSAQKYAEFIREPKSKYSPLCECARAAALLYDIDRVVQIIKTIKCPPQNLSLHHYFIEEMISTVLNAREFTAALELAQLIQAPVYRPNIDKRIFEAMLAARPLNDVIACFQSNRSALALFSNGVNQLLAKGECDQAVQLAGEIKDALTFDRARLDIVKHFSIKKKFDVGFDLALKIDHAIIRDRAIKKVFKAMVLTRPLNDVIAFFKDRGCADSLFRHGVNQLLAKGEYNQAVQLADVIQDSLEFDRARADIVKYLLTEQKPDVALDLAMKITCEKVRELILIKSIEYLVRNGKGSVELLCEYSQSIQEPGSYSLIAFLHFEQQGPDQEVEFMSQLSALYQVPDVKHRSYDEQTMLISQYLVKKGDIARALDYAQLIKNPLDQQCLAEECATVAQAVQDRDKATALIGACADAIRLKESELKETIKNLREELGIAQKCINRESIQRMNELRAEINEVNDEILRYDPQFSSVSLTPNVLMWWRNS